MHYVGYLHDRVLDTSDAGRWVSADTCMGIGHDTILLRNGCSLPGDKTIMAQPAEVCVAGMRLCGAQDLICG